MTQHARLRESPTAASEARVASRIRCRPRRMNHSLSLSPINRYAPPGTVAKALLGTEAVVFLFLLFHELRSGSRRRRLANGAKRSGATWAPSLALTAQAAAYHLPQPELIDLACGRLRQLRHELNPAWFCKLRAVPSRVASAPQREQQTALPARTTMEASGLTNPASSSLLLTAASC